MAHTSSTAIMTQEGPFPTLLEQQQQQRTTRPSSSSACESLCKVPSSCPTVTVDTPSSTSTTFSRLLSSSSSSLASSPATSPTASSSAFSAAPGTGESSVASPFSCGLVVRNTFLDFANRPRQELSRLRRSRSVELPRRTWEDQDELSDVSESSIANVGVGRGVAEVPYHLGQPLEKHSAAAPSFALADNATDPPTASQDFLEEVEEQQQEFFELPSRGSAGHRLGNCIPCGFFWKSRGCVNGERCEYCHLCDSREKKRRQKAKKRFCKTSSDGSNN